MKSNFNSETLLCSREIIIQGKNNECYKLFLPVLRDQIENLDFNLFISFCASSLEEINKNTGVNFTSKLSISKAYQQYDKEMFKILKKYCLKYMVDSKYVDDSLYWGKRLVGKEIFELFCDYCAIAAGVKSIKDLDLIITSDMDEYDKKIIENERRIRKTKASDSGGQKLDLDIALTGVCQVFDYTYEQLMEKTLYSIYYMYSQLGKIMNYEIGNIAAGNGLLGQHNNHGHWAMKN